MLPSMGHSRHTHGTTPAPSTWDHPVRRAGPSPTWATVLQPLCWRSAMAEGVLLAPTCPDLPHPSPPPTAARPRRDARDRVRGLWGGAHPPAARRGGSAPTKDPEFWTRCPARAAPPRPVPDGTPETATAGSLGERSLRLRGVGATPPPKTLNFGRAVRPELPLRGPSPDGTPETATAGSVGERSLRLRGVGATPPPRKPELWPRYPTPSAPHRDPSPTGRQRQRLRALWGSAASGCAAWGQHPHQRP
jgi:hypothetical protein